jgi:hypothetical protein
MPARLVQEVEENEATRPTRARTERIAFWLRGAVMVRLKRDPERADVAIVLSDDRARVVDRRVPDDAHLRDTVDRDPLAGVCRGSTGGFGGVM